jgi:hypothetical protein
MGDQAFADIAMGDHKDIRIHNPGTNNFIKETGCPFININDGFAPFHAECDVFMHPLQGGRLVIFRYPCLGHIFIYAEIAFIKLRIPDPVIGDEARLFDNQASTRLRDPAVVK